MTNDILLFNLEAYAFELLLSLEFFLGYSFSGLFCWGLVFWVFYCVGLTDVFFFGSYLGFFVFWFKSLSLLSLGLDWDKSIDLFKDWLVLWIVRGLIF